MEISMEKTWKFPSFPWKKHGNFPWKFPGKSRFQNIFPDGKKGVLFFHWKRKSNGKPFPEKHPTQM
jgi:hypothetical protein